MFEKSQVFNLSRFKLSICIWWFFVRVRTFEITEWVFVRFFFLNQLWLSFGVNMEIRLFPGKVNLKEGSVSYFKMNTLLLCVFTFRVDFWNVFFLVENEKVPSSERGRTICGFFKINTMNWVFYFGCVLLISTMICFAFFWWQEWQVQDSGTVLGHFQHRFWLFGNTP